MKTFFIFSLCLCVIGEEVTYKNKQERAAAIVQIESQGKRVLHDDFTAEGGKITKQSTFKADTFSVRFKSAAIATTGDLGEVIISDSLGHKTVMTFAQAISLAHEILRRCA